MYLPKLALRSALFAVVFSGVAAWSQDSRGTVLGRVTDSSGLVVPGVELQITNVDTSVAIKGASNGEGNYFFSFLTPGRYRITADKQGFKKFVRNGIEVNVNDRLEVNIQLEIGTTSETITVTEEAPLLDTTGGSVGRVVGFREARDLPMNHGDPDNLIKLSPGVNFTDSPAKDQPWQSLNTGYTMAGQRSNTNEFTLDGASNTLHDVARGSIAEAWVPPGDAVSEFKVQTATFDATTGQTQGAVVNVSLKSGTNKFHGTAYWGKQVPNLNANLFFANIAGQPIGNFHYDRLGGTFSGPVIVPKVYNGRNRTFFMFAYEHIHSVTIIGTVATVPTAAERNGDFSALLKLGANYQIYDPFTRVPAPNGRYSNQPLSGNFIPPSRISPIAQKILSYYPLPDPAGSTITADGGNNLNRSQWPSRIPYWTHLYKFDQIVNDKNRMMFRANFNYHNSNDTDYFGFDNPSLGAFFYTQSAGFAFDDVHSFSPSLVMDIRVSDSRYVRAQTPETPGKNFSLTSLGFPAAIQNQIGIPYRQFPAVTVNGYTSLGARTPLFKQTETRVFGVSFDKIRGGHDFKFGFEYRQYPDNQNSGSSSTGLLLGFTEAYTVGQLDNAAPSPRGQALAALLYGLPSSGTLTLPAASDFADKSSVWGLFLQDNWKATRKLALNLGLRYELESPMTERYNRAVLGFDPTAPQPFAAQVQANYAQNPTPEVSQLQVPGGLTFAGVGGNPRALYLRDAKNFMPRLGFAYSVTPKTVIRGGYGLYYGSLGTRLEDAIQSGFIQSTTVVPTLDGGQTFAATLANPFPNGFLPPLGAALGTLTNVGNSITFNNHAPRAARLQKFQVDIEHELPGHVLIDFGYMGSRNSDLEIARNLAALPDKYLSASPARDPATINYLTTNLPNPFNTPLFTGTGRAGSVISRAALLSPYPQFTGVSSFVYDGKAWYNAMNVRVEKRFSHGYTVQANYTFSKYIEATSYLNPGDAQPVRVISSQDFPHHVSLSGIYEFPFGHGRKFLAKAPSVVNFIVGGWQIAPVFTYQSGPPIGFGNAIVTCPLSQIPISGRNNDKVYRWFDTSCFNRASSQQLANNLITLSPRFSGIRADSYNSWDASMLKDTKIRENVQLEIRVEALNVLNQVTFAAPNTSPTSTSFGQVTAQMNVPRRMQFTLRLQF